MSYIGNLPPDIGAYDVESFNGGGTSFTLKRSATVSSVLLFIDGVRQTPTDAYTVSGVTLTTTATTPSGTDNVTVMFMGDVVDIGAPSADTVSTAKIQDDAVTAAKLANSINTEITANTAKVTNATHTGDVTGATALTIAVDAVDIAMLSATGTASASTFLRGDNAWAAAGGGKVLQVLQMTSATSEDTTSTSVADSVFTLTITPASSSNIIFVMVDFAGRSHRAGVAEFGAEYMLTNTTDTYELAKRRLYIAGSSTNWDHQIGMTLMGYDTGRSVATTYLLQYKALISGDGAFVNSSNHRGSMVIMEIEA